MKTMITAHSGCDDTPDNSFEFLEYAMACDADALEIDIHPSADGSYYLSHDPSDGACPDLKAAFALLRGCDKRINCDLKQPGMELGVIALAKEYGLLDRILLSGTVSPETARNNAVVSERTLLNIKPAAPELQEKFKQERRLAAADLEKLIGECKSCGVGVINIPFELCTDENLDIFRAGGIGVSAWTVNEEAVARRLLQRGIFNITTRKTTLLCGLRQHQIV